MLEDLIQLVTRVFVSCVFLFVGLGILLFEMGDPATQKLAPGWVGAVLGYWLQ
ncbi:MAG TPA: hypothetical protein VFJ76_06230 [Solirubrobacterales bacterium]|nr:hypothetical protein [Solirubrobacterales bacterium]